MIGQIKLIGVLYIVIGIFNMFTTLGLLYVMTNVMTENQSPNLQSIGLAMLMMVGFLALITVIAPIWCGFRLFKLKYSARGDGIILAILMLIFFPHGTVAGILALFVLLRSETKSVMS